ncbi:unnamed protein product [Withania somnifera]
MGSSNFLSSSVEKVNFRTEVLSRHLSQETPTPLILQAFPCLSYSPLELSEPSAIFDIKEMRKLMDGHNVVERDWIFGLMGGKMFVSADYNQSKEQQREITMRRIEYLLENGVFKKWMTGKGPENELRIFAFCDCAGIFDHSLYVKVGVHFFLWYVFVHFMPIF